MEPEHIDVPLQAKSLSRLSRRERTRYLRAMSLLAQGEGARSLPHSDMPLSGFGVYEALLAQSWKVRFNDPQQMIHLAEVAVEVAQGFNSRGVGTKRVADLRARAWGELANALRAADQLYPSREAAGEAFFWFTRGTGDRYLMARLFDIEASLLGSWREFKLSLQRLEVLSDLYRELGELHLAGRAMITQALYTSYQGQTEKAVALNSEGLELIDRERDPVLHVMSVFNHLLFLVDRGQYAQAKRALFEHRRHLIFKTGIGALRLRWIEGRISYGLKNFGSAEIAFREAAEGMAQAGMTLHGALASLELSMALVSQDKHDEAEREVVAAREIFLSLKIYREHVGSIIFLEECFRRRNITPNLIESTVALLWRRALEVVPQRRSESPRLDDPRIDLQRVSDSPSPGRPERVPAKPAR